MERLPFVGDLYIYKGNLHLKGCLPLHNSKWKMTKSLETLTVEKAMT